MNPLAEVDGAARARRRTCLPSSDPAVEVTADEAFTGEAPAVSMHISVELAASHPREPARPT